MTDAPLFASLKKPLPYTLIHSDCVEAMRKMPDASIDAVVCDPPYFIAFMSKKWDNAESGEAQEDLHRAWCIEALRVLKPGGHLLAFGGTRTYHRLACAVEDAGFEIRDCIMWCYGSGFPKSHDVSKAIDKSAGAERVSTGRVTSITGNRKAPSSAIVPSGIGAVNAGLQVNVETMPATDAAKKYQGWGSALKPAYEPVVVGRKPLDGTLAANTLKHGVGGLNIDGCRIPFTSAADEKESKDKNQHADFGTPPLTGNTTYGDYSMVQPKNYNPPGRWPSNMLLAHSPSCIHLDTADDTDLWACVPGCPIRALDAQSGTSKSVSRKPTGKPIYPTEGTAVVWNANSVTDNTERGFEDVGGASRFFVRFDPNDAPFVYQAKANTKDRNAGVESRNTHPTVKSTSLMQYLCRLVTPPGGVVLDPFMGSGSTGVAALREGFRFIGIEREQEYFDIATQRIEHAARSDS